MSPCEIYDFKDLGCSPDTKPQFLICGDFNDESVTNADNWGFDNESNGFYFDINELDNDYIL